jgi:hypothetical protein
MDNRWYFARKAKEAQAWADQTTNKKQREWWTNMADDMLSICHYWWENGEDARAPSWYRPPFSYSELRQRAELLLMAGYREDEVASNLLVEYPSLDEFQREDIPRIVQQVQRARLAPEVTKCESTVTGHGKSNPPFS